MQLADYFSDDQIIRQLCKERFKLARRAGQKQDIERLVGGHPTTSSLVDIRAILPPRRKWSAFRPVNRYRIQNVDLASLCHATLTLRESERNSSWVANLEEFVHHIRERVFSDKRFRFGRPRIKFQVKDGHKYRPLAKFALEDNIIASLLARYLRDFCDPAFEPSSYAFRAPSANGEMPTHHRAFEEIYRLKSLAPSRDFYVAECDIRGFYDTVDHQIALQSLRNTAESIKRSKTQFHLDGRASEMFQSYLDCYSFPLNVLNDALKAFRQNHSKAEVPWPAEALVDYHTDPYTKQIGVPQGGAISCIIANLVLDLADKRVASIAGSTSDIHYFRYCDDMILLTRKETECREVFEAYLDALKEQKLPYHEPVTVTEYGKDFWKAKSKQPYRWTGRKGEKCVPWVQFVGYQVRYDALVRIKAKSIRKQILKLRNTVDHVKFGLWNERAPSSYPSTVATKDQLMFSVRWKLVSLGVGRVNLKDHSSKPRPKLWFDGLRGMLARIGKGQFKPKADPIKPRPMCWAGGYKALNGKPLVPSILKRLDRAREQQICRMDQAVIRYGYGVHAKRSYGKGKPPFPSGYPFSYVGQFRNVRGLGLINHPFRSWVQRFVSHPFYLLCKLPRKVRRKLKRTILALDKFFHEALL